MKGPAIIRILLIFFGILLLANQVFNYLYIRRLDDDYMSIVTKETKELQSFEIITRESSDIQRALLNIAIVEPSEYKIWRDEITQSQDRLDSQYVNLDKLATDEKEKASIKKLGEVYSKYKQGYSALLVLLLAENYPGTHQNEKIRQLGGMYEYFMDQQEKQMAFFRQNTEAESEKLKSKSYTTSTVLLFVGTLPYLLFICVLIVSLVLVLWLGNIMNWFRQQE